MEIKDIKQLKEAIDSLTKFATGGAIRKPTVGGYGIDKCGTGFSQADTYTMAGKHIIHYYTYKGSYGNSGCTTQISLPSSIRPLFWEAFDAYLNAHQDEILLGVSEILRKKLSEEMSRIKDEINSLEQLLWDLETSETP